VDLQEGQILVHGLGALHLEIVENRLRDEWKAQFEFGQRRVSYRETLESHEAEDIEETWNSEVSGKPVSITLKLRLRRLMDDEPGDPAWDGNVVLDERGTAYTSPEAAPGTAASYIARGLASTLSNSPNSSLALTGICVEVVSCDYAPTTPLTALTGASAIILRNYLRSKGLGPLMEPFSTLKISVPESAFGKVVKDLTESGGELLSLGTGTSSGSDESDDIDGFSTDGVYVPPEWMSPSATRLMSSSSSAPQRRSIHAVAPLSRLLDYANRLRALSGGHGAFEMASSGFRQVSDGRKLDILREIGRA
jgi:elongation factor G